jgi:transketolase
LSKLHNDLANCIRFLSIDAVQKANSGHPGMPMGMADVATVLFKNFLRFNPKNPNWLNRDRFVLSAGHGSMLLYSLLYLTGYKSISLNSIKNLDNLTQYVLVTQNIILKLVLKLQQDHLVKELQMLLVLQLLKKF